MNEAPGIKGGQNVGEAAVYIAELSAELARMAGRHRLKHLAYLLELAALEARHCAGVEKSSADRS